MYANTITKRILIALAIPGLLMMLLRPANVRLEFSNDPPLMSKIQSEGPLICGIEHRASTTELREVIANDSDCVTREGYMTGPPLVYAAASSRGDIVELLLSSGANVNQVATCGPWEGATALHVAVEFRETSIVILLLEAGADPSIETAQYSSPRKLAKQYGNAIIRWLLVLD
jgi:ankyrin repeat protein